MPRYIADTSEEAIQNALKELEVTREEVIIRVVSEGKKGFLGLGKKEAEVLVEKIIPVSDTKEEAEDIEVSTQTQSVQKHAQENKEAQTEGASPSSGEKTYLENLDDDEALKELSIYLTRVTKEMGLPALVRIEKEPEVVVLHLETEKQGMLIGKHGKILNALQYLAQVFIHRVARNKLSVMVNVGNYREKRDEIVNRLAKSTAEKVKRTGEQVILEPMSAYERKQVHSALAKDPHIKTHSEGEEPYRYLIVEYEKNIL